MRNPDRDDTFMVAGMDLDQIKGKVREAIQKEVAPKKSAGPEKLCASPWAEIKEFTTSPAKVVYRMDGKIYGRTWAWDVGEENVSLGPKEELEVHYVRVPGGEKKEAVLQPKPAREVEEEEEEEGEDAY